MPAITGEKLFAILSWGGIGDTLRNISLIPHAAIFQRTGWRTPVVYLPWQQLGCRADALPPDALTIRDLVSRCPSLTWGGTDGLGTVARMANRLFRELLVIGNAGVPPIFAWELALSDGEKIEFKSDQPKIGIQTHLLGLPSKKWPLPQWRSFLEHLRKARPQAELHLIDPCPEVEALRFDEQIFTHQDLTLPQSIHLVRQMDYVISIDSWVKYVAAWDRIPQCVIIPDQRKDYPQLEAASLLRHEFATLAMRKEVLLIGLDKPRKQLTLPPMSQIRSDQIVDRILSSLPPLGTDV